MLLRVLFLTSFLIDDFLADNDFFGARSVVVVERVEQDRAGARALPARQPPRPRRGRRAHLAAATSPSSRGSAATIASSRTTTCASLPADTPTVFVDMAGNGAVVRAVHRALRDGSATAASSAARTGTRSRWGRRCPARRRRCSSRPTRSRSAPRTGARTACSSGWAPPGARSWRRRRDGFAWYGARPGRARAGLPGRAGRSCDARRGPRGVAARMRRAFVLAMMLAATAARGFGLDDVAQTARRIAAEPYRDRQTVVPKWMLKGGSITYDQWRDIRFEPAQSLWRKEQLPFQVQLFHPGLFFDRSVAVNLVEDGRRGRSPSRRRSSTTARTTSSRRSRRTSAGPASASTRTSRSRSTSTR